MVDLYLGKIPVIRRNLNEGFLGQPEPVRGGAVERDYSVQPLEMFASPSEMDLIPESEDDARYEEREATKSGLLHLFLRGGKPAFKNLDQNGQGFCWAYSTAQAIMMQRLAMGLPLVRLSAHAVACKIKNFRDQGGWGGLSAKFAVETGYPSCDVWPEQSMQRKYDTDATWADAAKHKITDEWVDLSKSVYDQKLTKRQWVTAAFSNQPGPADYSRFSHSMCRFDRVRIEKGHWGDVILQSWKNWGYYGLGILSDELGQPDGALAIRSVTIA